MTYTYYNSRVNAWIQRENDRITGVFCTKADARGTTDAPPPLPMQLRAPCRVCGPDMLFTLTNGRYYCNRCHIKVEDAVLAGIRSD